MVPVIDHPLLSYRHKTFLESFCIFTKSNNCVSLPMKHNLEIFHEVREIIHKNDMVKMRKIMENC